MTTSPQAKQAISADQPEHAAAPSDHDGTPLHGDASARAEVAAVRAGTTAPTAAPAHVDTSAGLAHAPYPPGRPAEGEPPALPTSHAPPPPRLRIGWHAVSAARLGLLGGDAHPPREPVDAAIPTRPPVPGPPRRPYAPVHQRGTAAALITMLAVVVVAIVVVATLASSPEAGPIAAAEPTGRTADGSQANAADPDSSYSATTAPTTAPAPLPLPLPTPEVGSAGGAAPLGPSSPARLPTSLTTTTTTATAKPAPAPTEICLPGECATWAGFDANGDILMVCDNLPDGYAGLVLYATSGGTSESKLWASGGSGTCEWRELSLAAGTPITYRVCKGDQSENRIDACSAKVTNTA